MVRLISVIQTWCTRCRSHTEVEVSRELLILTLAKVIVSYSEPRRAGNIRRCRRWRWAVVCSNNQLPSFEVARAHFVVGSLGGVEARWVRVKTMAVVERRRRRCETGVDQRQQCHYNVDRMTTTYQRHRRHWRQTAQLTASAASNCEEGEPQAEHLVDIRAIHPHRGTPRHAARLSDNAVFAALF